MRYIVNCRKSFYNRLKPWRVELEECAFHNILEKFELNDLNEVKSLVEHYKNTYDDVTIVEFSEDGNYYL